MFSSANRSRVKSKLKESTLDVIVIGGGITGAGIALDATTRGMKTALFEMQDFAAGTSSRSTKLIHGGLRYLKQFEVSVVSETGKERAIVYENGPHVTTPEWMMLPFYKGGTFGPLLTNIGLRVYDYLARVNKDERRQMLTSKEALSREPLLNGKDLKGAGYYVEYKTDDGRLTIEVIKRAVEHGALPLNYVKVTDLVYENNKVIGVEVEDQLDGTREQFYAKKIVNATGPWVDTLREVDHSKKGKHLTLTKGVHLVFEGERFPLRQAIYFDAPDGRMIFAIPRDGKTYIGTTDTIYEGNLEEPRVSAKDRDYLLNAIDYMFPQVGVKPSDVESSWAGLRPLIYEEGKDPSEISRKDEIFVSNTGLISIAGGKLTGYRKMAQQIVDLVSEKLQTEEEVLFQSSQTKDLPISGGDVGGSAGFEMFIKEQTQVWKNSGIDKDTVEQMVRRYGSNVDIIFKLYEREKQDTDEGLNPLIRAILQYAIDYESAYKPTDFFIRRTGAMFFDIDWVKKNKSLVIRYMSNYLNWTAEETEKYTLELEEAIYHATNPSEVETD